MFSVVSSFKNENKNCNDFFDIISKSKEYLNINEVIVVDNGSTDNTLLTLRNQTIKGINIKIFQNPNNSGYGDGFSKAIKNVTNDYIITLHSDNQFRLDKFLKKNSSQIISDVKKQINIFPVRINRSLIANLRTLIVRIIISIISFNLVKDYGGHPKFILKKNIQKIKFYPRGFSFDAALVYYIKKNKFKYSHNYSTNEHLRLFGVSSWDKNLYKQFILLIKFIYEFLIFKLNN